MFGRKPETDAAPKGLCSDQSIQDEVLRIKAAVDYGLDAEAHAMIAQATQEVFEYPVSDGKIGASHILTLGRDQFHIQDQYTTLLHFLLQERKNDLALNAIGRMSREQFLIADCEGNYAIDYADSPTITAMLEKLNPDGLYRGWVSGERRLWQFFVKGDNEAFINRLIDKTPASVLRHVFERMYVKGQASEEFSLTKEGTEIFETNSPETIVKIIQKVSSEVLAQQPGFYQALINPSQVHGDYDRDSTIEKYLFVADAIKEKMAGTLAPYVSQTAVMIHRPRNTAHELPAFNPDEAIDAALASGRASDAMQVGRSILDDCTVLLERFHEKNLESLAAAGQATKVLRAVIDGTRKHAQIADDVASGRTRLTPPNEIVRRLANIFPSLNPIELLENGLKGAGDDVRKSLAASQSLMCAYEDIQELHGPIVERLDHLQSSLERAVTVTTERIEAAPEDSIERVNAITLRDIFEATAQNARVSAAMIGVNARTAEKNARVEGKFVVAVMEVQSALNISLTNASMALSQIKEAATPELRRAAAMVIQEQSRSIANRMNAFEGAILDRERSVTTDIPVPARLPSL